MKSEKTNFFRASAEDFKKIPGAPVAYWVSEKFENAFLNKSLADFGNTRQGLATGDNNRFLRFWQEVSFHHIGLNIENRQAGKDSQCKWFPCHKGGSFRKWYGNHEYLVDWENDGKELAAFNGSVIRNPQYYFRRGLNWSSLSSGTFGMREGLLGFLFESKGSMFFANDDSDLAFLLGAMNSAVVNRMLRVLAPTLDYHEGPVSRTPIVKLEGEERIHVETNVSSLISLSKSDWDSYETSWDFEVNPLVGLCASLRQPPQGERIEKLYSQLRAKWARDCEEMRRLETENNRIFIDAYGLQDELSPDVPWHEITLTCNPFYRYGVKTGLTGFTGLEAETENPVNPVHPVEKLPLDPDLEARLRADIVKELVSYAVGCMMGRYSLEKPGLVLADQGSSVQDYYDRIDRIQSGEAATTETQNPVNLVNPVKKDPTEVRFSPDEDGIIPILDADWFADDIVTRFKAFVKAAFGEEHFFENMAWIEEALGKDVRSYFTKDFYKDHLQRYQNRPIYWLFQSPKGAFRALVYMHRYKPDMVGGVLGYLRSLQTKIDNQLDVALKVAADESKAASERVRANKDAAKYAKVQKELDEYEKNVLYPLSTERIEIDLDDGVKTNYRKFGAALAKVKALEGKAKEHE